MVHDTEIKRLDENEYLFPKFYEKKSLLILLSWFDKSNQMYIVLHYLLSWC